VDVVLRRQTSCVDSFGVGLSFQFLDDFVKSWGFSLVELLLSSEFMHGCGSSGNLIFNDCCYVSNGEIKATSKLILVVDRDPLLEVANSFRLEHLGDG
jgi:hypothetical protein